MKEIKGSDQQKSCLPWKTNLKLLPISMWNHDLKVFLLHGYYKKKDSVWSFLVCGCSSLFSCRNKCCDQKKLGEGRYLTYTCTSVHHGESSVRNSSRDLEAVNEAEVMEECCLWLAFFFFFLVGFSYNLGLSAQECYHPQWTGSSHTGH